MNAGEAEHHDRISVRAQVINSSNGRGFWESRETTRLDTALIGFSSGRSRPIRHTFSGTRLSAPSTRRLGHLGTGRPDLGGKHVINPTFSAIAVAGAIWPLLAEAQAEARRLALDPDESLFCSCLISIIGACPSAIADEDWPLRTSLIKGWTFRDVSGIEPHWSRCEPQELSALRQSHRTCH